MPSVVERHKQRLGIVAKVADSASATVTSLIDTKEKAEKYLSQSIGDIKSGLDSLTKDELELIYNCEGDGKNRASIIEKIENAIDALEQ